MHTLLIAYPYLVLNTFVMVEVESRDITDYGKLHVAKLLLKDLSGLGLVFASEFSDNRELLVVPFCVEVFLRAHLLGGFGAGDVDFDGGVGSDDQGGLGGALVLEDDGFMGLPGLVHGHTIHKLDLSVLV
jgi:hypothetical protein